MDSCKVAILIKKATLVFEKIANPMFATYGLTASQYRVLKLLYASESQTTRVVDLEQHTSMTHPTALGLLEQLERKGFTKRVANPNDARGKLICLTEKALALQGELEALGNAVEKKLTQNLTEKEVQQLIGLLNKLLEQPSNRRKHND